ncbi:MAG: amidohydrolase family protein [Hadesarchaea archaeon]|nr:amidohydrolase family protein [Hadesarchaea archaeon]
MDLIIRNAQIVGESKKKDIGIKNGEIIEVGEINDDSSEEINADGRLTSPAFIDPHIHLDKALIADELPPNESGTLNEAIELIWERKRKYTIDDIKRRAKKVIQLGISNGTTRMRTHVDVDTIGGLTPLEGLLETKKDIKDQIGLQIAAFPQEGIVRDSGTEELLRKAMEKGADLIGGMPHHEKSPNDMKEHVDMVFEIAKEFDVDIDMHVDETDDPNSRSLEYVAEKTMKEGYKGRVTAGHTCALAAYPDDYARKVIQKVKKAEMNVITNPATNLVIQGREDNQPIRRGITRVKELLEAGVNVTFGQDCVSDAFYPFGKADMLEVALITAHAAHLTMPEDIETIFKMMTNNAAKTLGVQDDYGVKPGVTADLVIIDAPTPKEAIRLQPGRWVIRKGRIVSSPQ